MNLFDKITGVKSRIIPGKSYTDTFGSGSSFLGNENKPIVPQTYSQQAPLQFGKTVQPKVYNPEIPLFLDEQKMLQKMKADNLNDEQAYGLLKQRRTDLLGGSTAISNEEKEILKKMQADSLSAREATELLKQRRYDREKESFNKAYEGGNMLQKTAYNTLAGMAGNLETIATYGGNLLDFATFGKLGFGEEVNKMKEVTQAPQFQESTAFKAGTYLPDVALAVSPLGGGYMAGAKGGMTGLQGASLFSKVGLKNASQGLMARSGVVGAGFGATQPILEKGSEATVGDIASGAGYGAVAGAVSAPVFGKAFKYGQAGYYGGATGMGKSIARDIKGAGQTAKAIGNAIAPNGANISTRANRFNALDEQKFIQATGQTPGEFATTRGMTKVGDDAVVEATNAWQASKAQADEAFGAIEGNFRYTGKGEDLLKTTIDDLDTRLLNTKSPDSTRIQQLKTKYDNTGLTMSEINEIKRAYANNYKYSFVDAGSESALRSKNLQDAIRKWQFQVAEQNGLANIADINKNTQAWKMYADSLAKKLNRGVANNANTLTDWIVLGGGNPENIALYLGKKLASSDLAKRTAIKLFSKQTKPSIIKANKADIQQANFQKNVNRGVSGDMNNSGGESMVRVAGLLPEPSGKASGAKNFRVNQPKEVRGKNDVQVGQRPKGDVKTENTALQLAKEAKRAKEIKYLKEDIASNTKSAQFGGTGEMRIKTAIDSAVAQGKITIDEAKTIVEEILDSVNAGERKYQFTSKKGLESLLEEMYSTKYNPAGEFDKLVTPTTNAKPKRIDTNASDTIPEGYFKNAFGEIVKNPSNKKGGFIRNPFAKPEPKRLFAGENSAQPPKGKTGWFKGADGKMRFEIDDSQGKIVGDFADKKGEIFGNKYTYKTVRLGDLLKHDELYKQYPELKNIRVEINSKMGNGLDSGDARWKDSPVGDSPGAIQFNENRINRFKGQSEYAKKRTLEIRNTPEYKKYYKEVENLEWNDPKFDEITKKFDNTELGKEYAIVSKDSSTYNDNFKSYLLHEIQHAIQTKENFAKGDSALSGIENYTNSAGEVEARNVQARMGLTTKERTIKKPESTEDVPRAKQIIRMDSKGPSLSVNKPIVKKAPDVAGLKKIDENSFINEKPIQVYRGEGKGVGNTTYVKGRYFADSKEFASTFGDVKTDAIPANSKIFDFDTIKNNVGQKVIPKDIYLNPDKLTNYLINKGYNVTKNTNSRGVEYVMLNKELNELINIADKYTSYNDFVKGIADDNRFWDIAKNEIKRTNTSRDDYSARDFAGEIWAKKQGINPIKEKVNPPIITTVKKIGPDLYGVFDEKGKKLTTSWNRNGAKDFQKMYLEGKYKS